VITDVAIRVQVRSRYMIGIRKSIPRRWQAYPTRSLRCPTGARLAPPTITSVAWPSVTQT
jgi:hypothetical protein